MASEDLIISVVGTVSTSATFGSTVYCIEVYNQGSDTAFVSSGADATLNSFPLYSGETIKLSSSFLDVRAITATGETATINVSGVY